MSRKSEAVASKAFEQYRAGDLLSCIMILVDYADRGVRNHRTEDIFKQAIRDEIALLPGDEDTYDDYPQHVVEGRFTHQGVSVSAYSSEGSILADEAWFTWDEAMDRRGPETDFTFKL